MCHLYHTFYKIQRSAFLIIKKNYVGKVGKQIFFSFLILCLWYFITFIHFCHLKFTHYKHLVLRYTFETIKQGAETLLKYNTIILIKLRRRHVSYITALNAWFVGHDRRSCPGLYRRQSVKTSQISLAIYCTSSNGK